VTGCPFCRAALDRATDDEDLRQWARQDGFPSPFADDPVLRALHEELLRASPESRADSVTPGAGDLGPPRREGDLGTLGPYRIVSAIGRGGLGIVYLGFDEVLARSVAIKVPHRERIRDDDRRWLIREARLASRFRHDHVVVVHSVEETADGLPFIVMEYVPGSSLAALVRERQCLDPREAAAIAAQVADGLGAANEAGLIHRDIKPANILIDRATGRARITDFGLARLAEAPASLDETSLVGTPSYMSPEQIRGEAEPDAKADQYSLGASLYEMLTGEPPFRGTPVQVLRQALSDDPIPPRRLNDGVPRNLETVCLKAMAKDPSRRYATARALGDDLKHWLAGEPIMARPVGRLERLALRARRRPGVALLVIALAGALAAGAGGVLWQWSRATQQRDEALKHQARARQDFRRAREAVDEYLTQVSEDPELKGQNLDALRRKLLGTARDFYERFVADHPDDPEIAADLGRAYGRLALVVRELESSSKAVPFYQKKLAIFTELLGRNPTDSSLGRETAQCLFQIGWGLAAEGRIDEAEAQYEQARQVLSKLLDASPSDVESATLLHYVVRNLGLLEHYNRGRLDRAESHYRDSLELVERILQARPGDAK
jgi:tetratricopeptide (TPR) repeat protein